MPKNRMGASENSSGLAKCVHDGRHGDLETATRAASMGDNADYRRFSGQGGADETATARS